MEKVVFFDIKTHRVDEFDELSDQMKSALISKYGTEDVVKKYNEDAGLCAEFGHVICCSLGFKSGDSVRVITLATFDEQLLLEQLSSILAKSENNGYVLGGYNSNKFDISYLIKRYIILGMKVPDLLRNTSKWEMAGKNIDLMERWRFGGNVTSFKILKACLGIKDEFVYPSNLINQSKDEIDMESLKLDCESQVKSLIKVYEKIDKSL